MSFFAARRRTASSSTSATTTTTTTTTKAAPAPSRTTSSSSLPLRDAAPLRQSVTAQAHALSSPSAANNRFVTVTRKVSKTGSTNNLKERERENAKLLREREAAAAAREEHQLAKDMASRLQQRQNGSLSKKNKKKAASTSSSSGSDSEPGTASRHQRKRVRSNPSVKGKEREVAHHAAARIHRSSPSSDNDDDDDDDESGELGTPVSDRRLPLLVPRDDIAAPLDDNAPPLPLISGEQLVRHNLSGYSRYFDEIPTGTTVTLEYPGSSQPETFLLLRPTVKDQQDYQPIQDIIETIRVVCDYFLTAEQAQTHFKHVQHQSGSLSSGSNNSLSARLSDGPAFPRAPSPLSAAITRDQTPASETGTPEPPSSAGLGVTPVAHKEPLIRTLEKAYNRQKGLLFLSAVEWYNSVMRWLKASGAVHDNIVSMGKTRGIPEVVWTRISGQCYERTVGPRVEELSRYEAFSDNTYGELLPPFVAHIASLTGLKQDSVLVDMGSGVGNCVVQASLATGCKSYGFENQEAASSIASAQVEELRARARLWGVSSGACEVHEADFLASPLVGRALAQASVVLVNNYVFSPATNESLSLLFLDLKDGAKIVSLKPFVHVSGGTEINARNVYSPQSILVQDKPYVYTKGSVSWSDRDGTFYIATVNRDRLKRYLEKMGH